MSEPLITVVIAAKDPEPRLLARCLSSFGALNCASRIELLLVLSGRMPALDDTPTAVFNSFKMLDTPARGVYAAFNAGIDEAQGRYTLFFGVDDIALPGLDTVANRLDIESYDVYAAACYMEGKGIRYPSSNRRSLIYANWCQQGIFYGTQRLVAQHFDTRYPIQADHKVNIDIVANPATRIGISKEVVAYFSFGGLSSLRHDLAFIRDFPDIISAAYGRPLGLYFRWRQRLSVWLRGPLEKRYGDPNA